MTDIQTEIKQKEFKSSRQKALVNLFYTHGIIMKLHNEWLKPHDISVQQFNILRILRGQHPSPASVNLLIDRMLDKSSNASRLVEKLRLKGLVERQPSACDRRQVDVSITKSGLALLKKLDKSYESFEQNFKALNQLEAEQLSALLDKLRTLIN